MRIAMFTNTYLPFVGGVSNSVETFVKELEYKGHSCLIVAPRYKGAEKSKDNVIRVKAIQNFNGSDFSLSIPDPITVSEGLNAFNPDIIHSHHPFLLGDSALRAARVRNIPIVFTHHTLYEYYTHYVPFDSKTMRSLVVEMAVKYCNMVDHVIAPSRSVKEYIEELGVKTTISEIPTGIDVDFFGGGNANAARKQWGVRDDVTVIGHVGRLAVEKNLEYLSRAVVHFLNTHKEACFLLVGEGRDGGALKSIFQNESCGDRVIFTGSLTGKALADAYALMDCFLFTSKSETQGMVLAEAMAAGAPVIALDAPGAREMVKDGENGRLLDAESSAEEFAEAIASFLHHSRSDSSIAESIRSTARTYSKEHCSELMVEVYQKALETNHKRSSARQSWSEWDALISRIRTEWDLLVEKAESFIDAINKSQSRRTPFS